MHHRPTTPSSSCRVRSDRRTARAIAIATVALSLVSAAPVRAQGHVPSGDIAGVRAGVPSVSDANQFSQAFTQVAQSVLPAVVSLHVEIFERSQAPMFWMLPEFGGPGVPGEAGRVRRGAGSGVVIRSDGTILTNNHVVEDAYRIRVRLRDGRMFTARVLGRDPAADLAVVRIDATGLPVARFGDSESSRVGEWVLAIGAPFGLEATVTHGVISATSRGGIGANQLEDYVQTDASINPGNSGGPLVNLRGEVLGINTITVGRGSGVGFAVPSRIARFVADQIIARGHVQRGWIGIGSQDVTPDLAHTFGVNGRGGAIVNQLASSGPAARGGIQVGDVVIRAGDRDVHDEHDLIREIALRGVGERVRIELLRGGRRQELWVTTASRPGDTGPTPVAIQPPSPPGNAGFGIMIDQVPPLFADRIGLARGLGAMIVQVFPNGTAHRAGLRPGDVVLAADGAPVRSTDDVIQSARDGRAVFLIRRGTEQNFVGVNMDTR